MAYPIHHNDLSARLEPLEGRAMFAGTPWGAYPQLIDQDLAVANFAQYNGAGQTIAIIDTGVDYNHPALAGKYLGGHDFVDGDDDPMDTDGHGTGLAALAVGNPFTLNGAKYQGIAQGAKVVALRVDDGGNVPDSRYEQALQWVIANRATYNISVVNLSFGSGHYTTEAARASYADEMATLAAAGVFIVAASGNDGAISPYGVEYPAADPSAFAAGSVENSDNIWKSTERGPNMDILAPGVNVPTAYINAQGGAIYVQATGTSFSAPLVGGAALIVKQIDPTFGAHDVMSILRTSGVDNYDGDTEAAPRTNLSWPRLDVDNAIALGLARRGGQASAALVGAHGADAKIAFDRDGVLSFAWYDSADKHLKFATQNVNGDWSAVRVIDAGVGVGQWLSLAMTSTGKPAVSYYDAVNADLKYAEWTGARWSVSTIDSRRSVGTFTSLAFDSFDDPVISYYYKNTGDLRVAFNDGSGWVTSVVESNQDVGAYSSFAISPSGQWSVAYEDTTTGQFKFAKKGSNGWSTQVIDGKTRKGGGHISLVYGPSSRPAVSYYDAFNADLKFAQFNGTTWVSTTVASKFVQGLYTNLFVNTAGVADIVYYSKSTNAVFRATGKIGGWSVNEIEGDGGRNVATARYGGSQRELVFMDAASGDLVFDDF